jgi:hypothetical protein
VTLVCLTRFLYVPWTEWIFVKLMLLKIHPPTLDKVDWITLCLSTRQQYYCHIDRPYRYRGYSVTLVCLTWFLYMFSVIAATQDLGRFILSHTKDRTPRYINLRKILSQRVVSNPGIQDW